jgi:hypothetical protein
MYRIHQHKLVVVQIETHKSYIKMNNNNNQLKNICWRGVFLLPFLGVGCFGFFSIEWNETNWEARQEKTKQTRRMRVWGRYRRITRKWTQDRAEKRGGTTSIKFKPIYIFFGITNVYIYTEKKNLNQNDRKEYTYESERKRGNQFEFWGVSRLFFLLGNREVRRFGQLLLILEVVIIIIKLRGKMKEMGKNSAS